MANKIEKTHSPDRRERKLLPPPLPRDTPYEKQMGTINVIGGGFTVYTTNISTEATLGKRLRLVTSIAISSTD